MGSLLRSVVLPDEAFESGQVYSVPRSLLVLLIAVVSLSSGLLAAEARPHDLGEQLLLRSRLEDLDALFLNAPPAQYERARRQAEAEARRAFGPAATAVSVLGGTVIWVILYFEMWLLVRLLVQFAGGEEQPIMGRPHRRSQYLVLAVLLPLVLSRLVEAAVLFGTGRGVYERVAAYEEYVQASTVSLSIVSVAGITPESELPAFLVTHITSPFVWWAAYVFVQGARFVYRLSAGPSLAVAACLLGLLSLQHAAITAVGAFFT